MSIRTICTMAALVCMAASPLSASSVVYTASGTNPEAGAISAQATFTHDGSFLDITLQNTGPAARVQSDALLGLMFTLGSGNLTPLTASLGAGSSYIIPSGVTLQPLGDEWQYKQGGSSFPDGTNAGVSAAGFDIFGHGNFGSSSNNLKGAAYGLVNGLSSEANKPMKKDYVFRNNAITLRLGAPAGFSLNQISNVYFQYGTGLNEPRLPGVPRNTPPNPPAVPEPGTMSLMGFAAMSALPFISRKRRK